MNRRRIVPPIGYVIAGLLSLLLGCLTGTPSWGWAMLGFFGVMFIGQLVGDAVVARRQDSDD